MDSNARVVIIGAGVFGLSTACQLASEGYRNITVLDRHMPPVPDGSSSDMSRVVRFDYADEDYFNISYEAYLKWSKSEKYNGIFHPSTFILVGPKTDHDWKDKTSSVLTKNNIPWHKLESAAETRRTFPALTGELVPSLAGYYNPQAGWVDANKAISQLRDDCLEMGVSFVCGPAGTVTKLNMDRQSANIISSVQTMNGTSVDGDYFILTAGAWCSTIVPMYNSVLAAAQVVAYWPLSDAEVAKYKDLPIYSNFSTGWFNLPPHDETNTLKAAIHGWGYTRTADGSTGVSAPPARPPRERVDFCTEDGEERLRAGMREIVPELADRPFERLAMCWYTDTPTGDFIMDHHPDFANLFVGGGGSGHGFKFLPVLGEYMSRALKRDLPPSLAAKWRFRTDYKDRDDVFLGDGSRGGPQRRELSAHERATLEKRDGPDGAII